MVTASLISRLSQAVEQLEERLTQNRSLKVVTVRRGWREDAALDRHYAAHPEDQDANIVLLDFCDDEEIADERQVGTALAGPACEKR